MQTNKSNALWTLGTILVGIGVLTYSACAEEKPTTQPQSKGKITSTEFDKLHQKLTKMSTEKVWSIPWQLSVRKARELAAKEKKPVFLWISSNGGTHPLGPC